MANTPYYQNDKKWQNNKIGFSNSLTIGQVGCMLTCFAMTVNHYGGNETPLSLNNKLVNVQGFNDAWIKGAQVPKLFSDLNFQRQKYVECTNKPAPIGDINTGLAAGSVVMVQVDREADSTFEQEDGHWVLLREQQGDDYTIWDPWYSETASDTLVGRYGFGRKKAEEIIQYVIWHGKGEFPTAPPIAAEPEPKTSKSSKSSKSSKRGKSSKPAPQTSNESLTVQSIVAQLTLRKQPRMNHTNILKILSRDDLLTVLTNNAERLIGHKYQWLRVEDATGMQGYVPARYVKKTAVATPTPAPQPAATNELQLKTAVDSVSLRTAPRIAQDTLVTYLPLNSKLTATEASEANKIGINGEWVQVKTENGREGYIAAWLVEKA